ncbi:hypothetical protein RVW00_000173 [Enterobacter bugandensis]|nr:hypothetical protein [Enterobacter bugandensis]
MSDIPFNPFKTYGVSAGFTVDTEGFVQGDALPDPAVEQQLCSGVLDGGITTPVYPGVGLIERITKGGDQGSILADVTAGSLASCNAFAVSNRAYHMILTPGNTVPRYMAGGSVHYYRLGSNARIPLPVSPQVALLSGPVGAQSLYWDPVGMRIDIAADPADAIRIRLLEVSDSGGMTIVYNPTTQGLSWNTQNPIGIFQI